MADVERFKNHQRYVGERNHYFKTILLRPNLYEAQLWHTTQQTISLCVTLYITSVKVGDKAFCISTHEYRITRSEYGKERNSRKERGEHDINRK